MFKTDLVSATDYFTFHMYFLRKRFYDISNREITRPAVWAMAAEKGFTYQDVEVLYTIKEILKK